MDAQRWIATLPRMHESSSLLVAFGQNVRKHRKQRQLTQEKFAGAAGLHRTYLADIERGARNLSILNVAKLAHALGLTISQLCQEIDVEKSPGPPSALIT